MSFLSERPIDFETFLKLKDKASSFNIVEDLVDYQVTHYFDDKEELMLVKVVQESFDEITSYGYEERYYQVK